MTRQRFQVGPWKCLARKPGGVMAAAGEGASAASGGCLTSGHRVFPPWIAVARLPSARGRRLAEGQKPEGPDEADFRREPCPERVPG